MSKMKKNILLTALLSGFFVTNMAVAGPYLVIDAGQTTVQGYCDGMPASLSCSSTANAARIGAGFQVNSMLGVEVSYGDYGKIDVAGTYLSVPVSGSSSVKGTQIAAVAALPLSNVFAFTGKLGVSYLNAKTDATGMGASYSSSYDNSTMVYGVGVRLNLGDTWGIRVQYENLGSLKSSSNDTSSTPTLVSAGLVIGM
jgi:OOP family OmpA-OmpF porin